MKKQLLLVLLVGIVAVGCSSRNVHFDYDRSADFPSFKTYAWHEGEQSIKEEDPLGHQRVMDAVDQQMSAKGLRKVSSSPDVYVTYAGEDNEQIRMDTTYMDYGYGDDWYWDDGMDMGMGSSTTQVRTYTEGTLVVDIWDAKKKQLIWRGVGSDTVSANPESNAKKIGKVVADLFKRYPPK